LFSFFSYIFYFCSNRLRLIGAQAFYSFYITLNDFFQIFILLSMPFFLNRNSKIADFSVLKTDMHSHILPGIDDGSPNVETSIQLIKELQDIGYSSFIATPHIYKELYPNNIDTINTALQQLKAAIQKAGLQVHIEAAAEYMVDESFEKELESDDLLLFAGNKILVEMSALSPSSNLYECFFKLQLKGITPVIAHPERYLFLSGTRHVFHEWMDRGYDLQVNILSLAGFYGNQVKDLANYLLKENLVHYLGTDAHNIQQVQALKSSLKTKEIQKILSDYTFYNDVI
jgi:protein-tyrosine phosphatase